MLDSGSYRYAYDALNRLVGVEKDGNTQREYSYDAFGNRTKKVDYTIPVLSGEAESGVETTLYCYNNANQLIAEQLETSGISKAAREKVYRYDRRGNLVEVCQGEELLKQFTFDPANRMSGSAASADGIWKQATYQYNGLGQRVGQEIWNSLQNPEQSIRNTLDLTKQYHNLLHLGDMQNGKNQTFYWDGNVVSMQEDGEESLYLQDDLGSPVELLNAEGGIREHYAFDEFGTSLNFGEQLQPFGFTGYQMDVAGGLYFAQARRYDASTGRFISEDKVKGFADAPFTLNPYSYCWNKPMELVDLNGLEPQSDWLTEGNEAHTLLQAEFMTDYGASGGQVEYYVNSGITANISGTGRADIVYFNGNTQIVEVYEIKPGSYSPGAVNYSLGICQLDGYISALQTNSQIKSEHWDVARGYSLNTYFDTMVIDSVEYENMEIVYKVYENGLINYYRKKQQPNQVPVSDGTLWEAQTAL